MDSKLTTFIKKQARPKLILSIILIIASLTLLFYYRSFVKSKTIGADVMTSVSDVMAHFDSGDVFVDVDADELYSVDLIVETTTTTNGSSTTRNTSFFTVMEMEDMFLIVQLPYKYAEDESFSYSNVELSGKLKKSTSDFDVLGNVSEYLSDVLGYPSSMIKDELLIPYYLDTTFDTFTTILSLAGLAVLLFSIFNLIFNIIRLTNPRSHRIYKQIRALGDEERIESTLDRELDAGSNHIIANPSNYNYITTSYILSIEKGKLALGRTEDIVWAYRRDVKNRGVTTYYIVLCMKDRKARRSLIAKRADYAENAMSSISARLPVLCGYSAELNRIYNKNPDEFQRLLDQRRAEFDAANQPYSAPDTDTATDTALDTTE